MNQRYGAPVAFESSLRLPNVLSFQLRISLEFSRSSQTGERKAARNADEFISGTLIGEKIGMRLTPPGPEDNIRNSSNSDIRSVLLLAYTFS